MKILHIADCHLDSAMETSLTAPIAKMRRQELLLTFKDILSAAAQGGARLVLMAGDLFDTPSPQKSTVTHVLGEIASHTEMDFILIEGNHDMGALATYSLPENLHLVQAKELASFRFEDVCVFAAGYGISPQTLAQADVKKEDKNILLAHGTIGTAGESNEENLPRHILEQQPFDYIALGHYHSHRAERINERTTACYAGIPEGRGFDEAGICGVVFLDSDSMRTELVPSARRTLHRLSVDISGASDAHDVAGAVYEQISSLPDKDMVHLTLTGHYSEKLEKDLSHLETMLSRFYFYRLKDESLLALRPEDYKNDFSLRGEFVRRVFAENFSEEDRSRILDYGLRALAGENPID